MIPQYAKSNDPEVLAAVEERNVAYRDFTKACDEIARRYGSPDGEFMVSSGFGSRHLAGLPFKPEGHGKWKNPRGRTWLPYANNPAAKDFALKQRHVDIPGLPTVVYGEPNRDGSTPVYTVHAFIQDGYAWHGLPGAPGKHERQESDAGPQWTEVLTSQYFAALEAHNADRKAKREAAG